MAMSTNIIAEFGAMILHNVIVKTPLHPEKVTIWCALWTSRIIGPYVFKNVDGQNVAERYRDMISNFFVLQLGGINVGDMWFQQVRDTINLLQETLSKD